MFTLTAHNPCWGLLCRGGRFARRVLAPLVASAVFVLSVQYLLLEVVNQEVEHCQHNHNPYYHYQFHNTFLHFSIPYIANISSSHTTMPPMCILIACHHESDFSTSTSFTTSTG